MLTTSKSFQTVSFLLLALAVAGRAYAKTTLATRLAPFLSQHCFDCHSGDAPEAGLDLSATSTNVDDADIRQRWVYLYDRVASGEMPPQSVDPPDAEARDEFLRALADSLTRADLVDREVILRRLNRREYENSVRDLFGIYVDVQSVLPDDSVDQGFDTIGSDLSLSAEQMVTYIEAADLVLDKVFGQATAPRRIDKTVNIKDTQSKDTADRVPEDGVVLFSGAKSLALYGVSVPDPGVYRLQSRLRPFRPIAPSCFESMVG